MNSNWMINRVGLIDFWYYDEEEFWFSKGRMLLRGANGSGKSVTMQSLIPLLLDGNMRPERLDAFGSRARKMDNYLLEEEDDREERTGYLYMELVREESEEYLSFGIGLRARKNKPLDSWYFHIHDGRRIGRDFLLYKKLDGKVALTKTELKNRIGEGGRVLDEQREYMALVNKVLFGFETEEEYKELLDLLIRLRAPKLSKELKPTVLSEVLSSSLRPLSEDDLKPMADAIEKMDETKLNLDSLKESLLSAKQIEKVYRLYNEVVLSGKASYYLEARKEEEAIKKERTSLEKDLEKLRREQEEKEEEKTRLSEEERTLKEEENSLSDKDVMRLKGEEEKISEEILEYQKNVKNKEKAETEKAEKEREYQTEIREKEGEKESLWKEIEEIFSEMETEMEEVPFDEFYFMRDELEKKKEEKYNFNLHTKTFEDYYKKVEAGKEVLEEEKKQNERYDDLLFLLDGYREKQEKLEKEERQCETLLHEEKQRMIEAVYTWERENEELHLKSEEMQTVVREIENYEEGRNHFDIKNQGREVYEKISGSFSDKIIRKKAAIREVEGRIEELKAEISEWKNKKEPEPKRSEEVIKNRERLEKEGITYLNFYKVIDFEKGIEEEEKNRLEEALFKMGILDSLIVSAGDRERILSADIGLSDCYIFDDAPSVKESILDKFIVEDGYNDIVSNHKIMKALSGIGVGRLEKAASWIGKTGEYGHGILEGRGSGTYQASFIGAASRERFKAEKIKKLEEEIKDLQLRLNEEMASLATLEKKKAKLVEEWEAFPTSTSMDEALRLLKKNRDSLKNLLEEMEGKKKELEKEREKLNEIRLRVKEVCSACFVAARLDVFTNLLVSLEAYRKLLSKLQTSHVEYFSLLSLINIKEENLFEIQADLEEIRYDLGQFKRKLRQAEGKLDSIREQLSRTDYEKIKERLDFLVKRLKEIPTQVEKLGIEIGGKQTQVSMLSERLESFGKRIEKSEKKREFFERGLKEEVALGILGFLQGEEESFANFADRIRRETEAKVMGKKKEDVSISLQDVFFRCRGSLNKYQIGMETLFEGETDYAEISMKRLQISAKYRGGTVSFNSLVSALLKEEEELEGLLRESDREIYEDILIGTVGRKIRAKIYHSEKWVKRIQTLMEAMETSSGLTLSLNWRKKQAEKEEELSTKALVEILLKDAEILRPEDSASLSGHFRSKIQAARKMSEESGGMKSFYGVIKEVLDYRKWFEFVLLYQKAGEKQKVLTDKVFFTFSGGEKAMAMYVPLFSAVVAKYDGARKDVPRLVALDEAFAGVDEMNIRDMFRLMVEFRFNFIINSQSLWGDYDTVPSLSIYQLVRPDNVKYVSAIRYLWNGVRRELSQKKGVEEGG